MFEDYRTDEKGHTCSLTIRSILIYKTYYTLHTTHNFPSPKTF